MRNSNEVLAAVVAHTSENTEHLSNVTSEQVSTAMPIKMSTIYPYLTEEEEQSPLPSIIQKRLDEKKNSLTDEEYKKLVALETWRHKDLWNYQLWCIEGQKKRGTWIEPQPILHQQQVVAAQSNENAQYLLNVTSKQEPATASRNIMQ